MDDECTVSSVLDFTAKKWTLLILLEVYKRQPKKVRYSEIKRSIKDITPKLLSVRLKELEKEELLIKTVDSKTFPIKSEYELSNSGKEFVKIIQEMKKWGLKWLPKKKVCDSVNCKDCAFNI